MCLESRSEHALLGEAQLSSFTCDSSVEPMQQYETISLPVVHSVRLHVNSFAVSHRVEDLDCLLHLPKFRASLYQASEGWRPGLKRCICDRTLDLACARDCLRNSHLKRVHVARPLLASRLSWRIAKGRRIAGCVRGIVYGPLIPRSVRHKQHHPQATVVYLGVVRLGSVIPPACTPGHDATTRRMLAFRDAIRMLPSCSEVRHRPTSSPYLNNVTQLQEASATGQPCRHCYAFCTCYYAFLTLEGPSLPPGSSSLICTWMQTLDTMSSSCVRIQQIQCRKRSKQQF